MAEHASEPLAFIALEEIPISVSPTAAAAPSLHAFCFRMHDDPLYTTREPRVIASLESVTNSVTVTATRTLDTPPLALSMGFPVSGTQPAMATSAVWSVPLGSCAYMPPLVAIPLHPGSSVDGSSAMRAQHLLATVLRLQGMAFSSGPVPSLPPPLIPEVLV